MEKLTNSIWPWVGPALKMCTPENSEHTWYVNVQTHLLVSSICTSVVRTRDNDPVLLNLLDPQPPDESIIILPSIVQTLRTLLKILLRFPKISNLLNNCITRCTTQPEFTMRLDILPNTKVWYNFRGSGKEIVLHCTTPLILFNSVKNVFSIQS